MRNRGSEEEGKISWTTQNADSGGLCQMEKGAAQCEICHENASDGKNQFLSAGEPYLYKMRSCEVKRNTKRGCREIDSPMQGAVG